jgi:hypothetical protein
LTLGEQRGLSPALQNLAQERAAGLNDLAGEFGVGFGQRHDAQVVGKAARERNPSCLARAT